MISLQAFNHGHAHPRSQVGAFPVGFLAPAPARIAEEIEIGGPIGEPEILTAISELLRLVEFRPGLVGDRGGDAVQQRVIECGGHAHGLREDGGDPGAGDAMETFVPPIVFWNAEAFDGRGLMDG